MTDELITDLSHIHSLRVISHSSATALRGAHLSVPEIADKLNVDAVVEGTILRSSDKVRVNVQLIAAHPEQHLWAAQFERSLGDAVTLQNEIAAAAVAQMRTEITPEEHAQLQVETPVNPEAHDECLRGRFLLDQERPEQVVKAIPHFQRAIQVAPAYADAYALLGEGLAYEGIYGVQPLRTVLPQAIAYSRKAMVLDPHSTEAYEGLGMSLTLARQWQESEAMLRHSLELNPNNPRAAEELAILLDMVRRGDEAIGIMRRSAAANPVSVRSQRMYANVLYRARHFDEAIDQSRHVLELDPSRPLAYSILGDALAAKGRYAEADEAFHHMQNWDDHITWLAALRGDYTEARRLMAAHPIKNRVLGAVVDYLLGDRVTGIRELDRLANQDLQVETYFLTCDPLFDPMRGDPRFAAIVRKTGLPE